MEIKTYIKPLKKNRVLDFKELYRYKDLLYFLTIRGFKAKYAQSILGIGWAIIQPLFLTLIFTVVFGRIAKVSSDGIPYLLFSLTGIVPWTFFSGVLTEASGSLIANSNMISKVYFPRVIVPLSSALSKLVDFVITLIVLIVFLFLYQVMPGVNIIYLPFLFILLFSISIASGTLFAAMSVKFRDIKHLIPFAAQILLYATPVAYPSSVIPEKYKLLYALNPMVGVVDGFRSCILNSQPLPTAEILIGTFVTILITIYSLIYFNRSQRTFADVA